MKYAIRYTINIEDRKEGYSSEDVTEKGEGLTDGFIFVSILFCKDGTYSQQIMSHHGKERRHLTQEELFNFWNIMGCSLHDSGKLTGWNKEVVELHTSLVRGIFRQKK